MPPKRQSDKVWVPKDPRQQPGSGSGHHEDRPPTSADGGAAGDAPTAPTPAPSLPAPPAPATEEEEHAAACRPRPPADLPEPPGTGPCYERHHLLRLFTASRDRASSAAELRAAEAAAAAGGVDAGGGEGAVRAEVSLKECARDFTEPEDLKAVRRAQRQAKSAEKKAKKASADEELGEDASSPRRAAKAAIAASTLQPPEVSTSLARVDSADEAAGTREDPPRAATPKAAARRGAASPGGAEPPVKIALSQELPADGQHPQLHPMTMAYISSMAGIAAASMAELSSMAYASAAGDTGIVQQCLGYTTVMLRNIPNRYARDMLVERLNQTFSGEYDFVYLPIDFNSKCNVGYAFINFRTPIACQRFIREFHGQKARSCLPGFSSVKVCEVSYARVQGRDANMENLCDEKFIEKLNERPDWQPLFYDASGNEIPFARTVLGGRKRTSTRSGLGSPTSQHQLPMSAGMGLSLPGGGSGGCPSMFGGMPPHLAVSPYGQMPGHRMPTAAAERATPSPWLLSFLPTASSSTTVALRSVPARYTRTLFVERLNKHFRGAYDFMFLPGDEAKGDGNRGLAFVNFRWPKKAQNFTKMFHNTKACETLPYPGYTGGQVCQVVSPCFMQLEKSLDRLRVSLLNGTMEDNDPWLPLSFDMSGEPCAFNFPARGPSPACPGGAAASSNPRMTSLGFLPPPAAVGAAQAAAAEAAAAAQAAQRAAQAAQAAQRGVQQAAQAAALGGSSAGIAPQQIEAQYMRAVQEGAMRKLPMEFYSDGWGKTTYTGQPDQFADASSWTYPEYDGFSGSNIGLFPYG